MTRHNKGVYEPQLRLVLMVVASLNTIPYVGFGYSVATGANIMILIAFLSVQTATVPFATSSMFTYVMDYHGNHVARAFATMNSVTVVPSFVMRKFVNEWFETSGPKTVFSIVAIANLSI